MVSQNLITWSESFGPVHLFKLPSTRRHIWLIRIIGHGFLNLKRGRWVRDSTSGWTHVAREIVIESSEVQDFVRQIAEVLILPRPVYVSVCELSRTGRVSVSAGYKSFNKPSPLTEVYSDRLLRKYSLVNHGGRADSRWPLF